MTIETHTRDVWTDDGVRLCADITWPDAQAAPRGAAVLCHPHPLYGGDRHHPVLVEVAARLARAGVVALRFDFRGGGESDGAHDGGRDERHDVSAALDVVCAESDGPTWLVGYSFGAAVALGVVDRRLSGWVAVAPPLAMVPGTPGAAIDPRPVHLFVPQHDQFSPPEQVGPAVAAWTNCTLTVVESADHMLHGHVARVADLVAAPIVSSLP